MAYAVADLAYDPDTHTTTDPDGRDVPHVTAVLGAVGVATDFEALAAAHPRVAENIRRAADRGTAVHADCHAYDDLDLDWASVHPEVFPYVEAWSNVRAAVGLTPILRARERRLYHPIYNFTGIPDGVFLCHGKRILPDLKTGDPDDAAAHLQTAAYELAWNYQHPDEPIDERWAIWLRPGQRVPYTIINYTAQPTAWLDAQVWLACLAVYNAQPGRRRPIR